MSATVISSTQFWLCTFGLILFWIVVLTTAALPSNDDTALTAQTKEHYGGKEQHINERNCKALCKHCGCMGFYCGEECICECNDDKSDTECINTMQNNARKLNIPFQLLIQGPTSNGFVRNALQYSYDGTIAIMPHRNRRSTVVIYKPAIQNSLIPADSKLENFGKNKASEVVRHKRAVGKHFDWFSDFANTLVRPAPLGGAKKTKQTTETSIPPHKRAASKAELDRSWFSDNTNSLLRPAPLFKRQRSSSEVENNGKNMDTSMNAAVEKFPKVLKDTLRSIQGTTMGGGNDVTGNIGDTLRSHIEESTNVLQSQLVDNNFEFLPTGGMWRDNIQQTLSNLQSQIFPANNDNGNSESAPLKKPRHSKTVNKATRPKLTWFRPVRFLQRVQQAIN